MLYKLSAGLLGLLSKVDKIALIIKVVIKLASVRPMRPQTFRETF